MKHSINQEEVLKKMQRFCAYQDRCHSEVRNKLLELEVYGDRLESIMAELIRENFLNEERFARSFARGKFRMKQWGRLRILQELGRRDISEYCIRKAMEELDESEYQATLRVVLERKQADWSELPVFESRQKLVQYALRRGFEADLAWKILDTLMAESK